VLSISGEKKLSEVKMNAGVSVGIWEGCSNGNSRQLLEVGAQSLQPILEYAVIKNEEGQFSVAYGNAALVACIKLAQRVLALEAKLEQLTKDKS
jgi:hypothetical protein